MRKGIMMGVKKKNRVRHWMLSLAGYCCFLIIAGVLTLYLLGYIGEFYVLALLVLCPLTHFLLMRDH